MRDIVDVEKAKEIVTLLANGTDPTTGEVLADDSPYNHPTVIRALFTVLDHIRIPKKQSKLSVEEKQAQNLASGKPKNAGLPWTEDLQQEVVALFRQGKTVNELALHFERTEGAIVSELEHQGITGREDRPNLC
jgi:hypothetical protein